MTQQGGPGIHRPGWLYYAQLFNSFRGGESPHGLEIGEPRWMIRPLGYPSSGKEVGLGYNKVVLSTSQFNLSSFKLVARLPIVEVGAAN